MNSPFVIRPGSAADHPYVVDSWVMTQRGAMIARDVGKGFGALHRSLVRWLLTRAQLTVACLPRDTSTIMGWACTERGVVHYVQVMRDVRRSGLAKLLLAPYLDEDTVHTHRCFPETGTAPVTPPRWKYVPIGHWAVDRLVHGEPPPLLKEA